MQKIFKHLTTIVTQQVTLCVLLLCLCVEGQKGGAKGAMRNKGRGGSSRGRGGGGGNRPTGDDVSIKAGLGMLLKKTLIL